MGWEKWNGSDVAHRYFHTSCNTVAISQTGCTPTAVLMVFHRRTDVLQPPLYCTTTAVLHKRYVGWCLNSSIAIIRHSIILILLLPLLNAIQYFGKPLLLHQNTIWRQYPLRGYVLSYSTYQNVYNCKFSFISYHFLHSCCSIRIRRSDN